MSDYTITIDFSDEERELLERVRQLKGMDNLDQAAEWLVKTRLRRQAWQMNGRGRALYVASRNGRPE